MLLTQLLFVAILNLQAAANAAKSSAEARVSSLLEELSSARASSADAADKLQAALQQHDSKLSSLKQEHQAAVRDLQAQNSSQQQLLQAASTRAEEDSAALAAAHTKITEQEGQINSMAQETQGGCCALHFPQWVLLASSSLSNTFVCIGDMQSWADSQGEHPSVGNNLLLS